MGETLTPKELTAALDRVAAVLAYALLAEGAEEPAMLRQITTAAQAGAVRGSRVWEDTEKEAQDA